MKHHRLAIVRQKYRPDGGAERFVSRALTALSNQNLELNVITTFAIRESGAASAASVVLLMPHVNCGNNNSLILCKATSESRAVTSTAQAMASTAAGYCSVHAFYPPGVQRC